MSQFLRISFAFALVGVLTASVWPAEDIVASAPMELQKNWPHVQVMVNGKGPFTFVLDTGTGGDALVTRHLAEQLSLPIAGEKLVDDDSGVKPRKVPAFRLDSVSVAGVEFKNVSAGESPEFDKDFDGILGFTLFRDYLLTLDYPNQKVTLAHGSLPAADGKDILAFTMPDKRPFIELIIDSRKVEVCVDSGGQGLSLPAKSLEGLKFVSKPIAFARAQSMSNDVEIKGAQLASDIHLGAYILNKPFLAIDTLSPIGNVGGLLLKNFAVTFDQNNKLVQFVAKDKKVTLRRGSIRRTP
jgi:hypothetical protein